MDKKTITLDASLLITFQEYLSTVGMSRAIELEQAIEYALRKEIETKGLARLFKRVDKLNKQEIAMDKLDEKAGITRHQPAHAGVNGSQKMKSNILPTYVRDIAYRETQREEMGKLDKAIEEVTKEQPIINKNPDKTSMVIWL